MRETFEKWQEDQGVNTAYKKKVKECYKTQFKTDIMTRYEQLANDLKDARQTINEFEKDHILGYQPAGSK